MHPVSENPKKHRLTITLFFIGLFILLALRDISVGIDLVEYKKIFERCYKLEFSQLSKLQWEIGYTTYCKIFSLFSQNYRFFLIVTAGLTLIPIYKLYAREEKYSFLLIVLFINMPCFVMIFSGLRQAIAISLGILAYMAIEKKKHILGLLFIALAVSFHVSAIVLVLIYAAYFIKIKTVHMVGVIPAMLAVYVYRIPIFNYVLGFLPEHYIEFYGEVEETGAVGMMLLFLVFAIFSFVILDEKTMSHKDYFLRNLLLMATISQFFVPVHGLVQRASYYFLIIVPVVLIRVVQAPKKALKGISDLAVIVMVCFFTFYKRFLIGRNE